MIIRSYSGRSVPEALEKVRADLGAEALIVETRSLREPGLLGRRIGYEIVAASASDEQAVPQAPAGRAAWRRDLAARIHHRSRSRASQAAPLLGAVDLRDAASERQVVRQQAARLARGQKPPTTHLGEELAQAFEEAELPGELIAELDELVARAGERLTSALRPTFCRRALERWLDCRPGLDWRPGTHLLMVGPTGVGKTTTIAKLAGDLALRRGKSIGLITIDTYRIGAADQLATYADLLEAPCAVARDPAELATAMARMQHCDHILIDSAGRSPTDAARVAELRPFATAVPGLRVMLAIAATCGRAEFASVVERFSLLPIEHTVLTKLDECIAGGRLLGCLRRHRLPLDYLTTGQEVPDDIEPACVQRLSGLLVRVAQSVAA